MAAEIFDRQLALTLPDAIRTIARLGARRALACAVAGEVDRACVLAGRVCSTGALQVGDTRHNRHGPARAREPG